MSENSVSFPSVSAHGKGQLVYHLEWCPKYRFRMLRQERFKNALLQSLEWTAQRLRVKFLEVGIQDDHVHVVALLRPVHSISGVLEALKGESARALFAMEPKFRFRYPAGHFWSPGKFYRSVGDVDLETVRNYVRAQDHRQRTLAQFSEAA